MNDVGGALAEERLFEAMSEERFRILDGLKRDRAWLPVFSAPAREQSESARSFDARLLEAIDAWLPSVEMANPSRKSAKVNTHLIAYSLRALPGKLR